MSKGLKKLLLALAGIMLIFVAAGCSNNNTVATTKGGKITKDDYYNEMKKSSAGKSTLQTMIITQVLEDQYGKKVSDKQVTKEYNKYKDQYGSSFSSLLQQNGMTTASFKKNIRTNLLTEAALKANKKVTNANLKTQWKSYEPKVTVAHIVVSSEDAANDIINQLNSGAKFADLAKKSSTDSATKNNGGKLPAFDNTDTSMDSATKKAAFKLKNGEYTKTPVKTESGYEVIEMIKNPGKGKMSDHTAELKTQLYNKWMQDSTVMQGVIAKSLKKGNVSIKDNDMKDILAGYLQSSKSTSGTGSTTSSAK
ncbi:peptidylprolyl isomerase [Agrilactobacillus composti DSM 18527 = JCM 14202]|uniref:Foldase protein PrsA n=1 Tax=Agrilactobacillus composti DSM 18527 = JCM 14202 TaxID=1423734 RepID=X0PPN1_9LACO|nr:peptidylprolyl isomerase PrsA [Agrilactobacillus composti]KRM35761.1 peptidylprolyl isomerase [Agrilactobacillus composti DSM 18527 = JCM 14202]GAF39622.1 foldase protein PrsA precursor [Agrilactobacillus composti DSM 18527 = JCM 14202]